MDGKATMLFLVFSIFLLSGCAEIGVNQKIKRNGNFDVTIVLKADSPDALKSLHQHLEINPAIQNKHSYEEIDNKVIYRFKNVDLSKEQLFKERNPSFASTQQNGSNVLRREFKFPYYHYVYEFNTLRNDRLFEKISGLQDNSKTRAFFKTEYTVEVFGKIVETSGNKISSDKAKFHVNHKANKKHYIKFKDFFVSNWAGTVLEFLKSKQEFAD